MTQVALKLTRVPRVPVFADIISPDKLANKTVEEIMKLELLEGNTPAKISELFDVKVEGEPSGLVEKTDITVEGNLSKFHYIGRGMSGGLVTVNGDVGSWVGSMMSWLASPRHESAKKNAL